MSRFDISCISLSHPTSDTKFSKSVIKKPISPDCIKRLVNIEKTAKNFATTLQHMINCLKNIVKDASPGMLQCIPLPLSLESQTVFQKRTPFEKYIFRVYGEGSFHIFHIESRTMLCLCNYLYCCKITPTFRSSQTENSLGKSQKADASKPCKTNVFLKQLKHQLPQVSTVSQPVQPQNTEKAQLKCRWVFYTGVKDIFDTGSDTGKKIVIISSTD